MTPLGTFATPDARFNNVHIDIIGPLAPFIISLPPLTVLLIDQKISLSQTLLQKQWLKHFFVDGYHTLGCHLLSQLPIWVSTLAKAHEIIGIVNVYAQHPTILLPWPYWMFSQTSKGFPEDPSQCNSLDSIITFSFAGHTYLTFTVLQQRSNLTTTPDPSYNLNSSCNMPSQLLSVHIQQQKHV